MHTELLKNELVRDFYEMYPEKFNNKTNGITQRRWLRKCNPGLSTLISEQIGEGWITHLDELKQLENLADNQDFQERWRHIKRDNKERLVKSHQGRHGYHCGSQKSV